MILGIDTSIGTGVAVIEADGVVRSALESPDPRGHAEVIGTLIDRALREAEAGPDDIEAVAAGMGPGPFTGLRVGIAAARAFALGRGVRFVPVVSHDAVALSLVLGATVRGTEHDRVAVVTDARRREFAYTIFDGIDDDGLPVRRAEPALAAREHLDEVLAHAGAMRWDAASVPAEIIALVASRALDAGRVVGPDDALYLRSPDVTIPAGPKRVVPSEARA